MTMNVDGSTVKEAIEALKTDFNLMREGRSFDDAEIDASMMMLKTISSFFNADKAGLKETYSVMAVSTSNLPEDEVKALELRESTMLMKRDTGFFIKLYEEQNYSLDHWKGFTHLSALITYAHDLGFRMIEFDGKAPILETFPKFDW